MRRDRVPWAGEDCLQGGPVCAPSEDGLVSGCRAGRTSREPVGDVAGGDGRAGGPGQPVLCRQAWLSTVQPLHRAKLSALRGQSSV